MQSFSYITKPSHAARIWTTASLLRLELSEYFCICCVAEESAYPFTGSLKKPDWNVLSGQLEGSSQIQAGSSGTRSSMTSLERTTLHSQKINPDCCIDWLWSIWNLRLWWFAWTRAWAKRSERKDCSPLQIVDCCNVLFRSLPPRLPNLGLLYMHFARGC